MHLNKPYPHFLINSTLDYAIQDDVRNLMQNLREPMGIRSVLIENPSTFKSFYSPSFNIFIEKDRIVMDNGDGAFPIKFCIGLADNELEFEVPSKPFKKLFKFMGPTGAWVEPRALVRLNLK